MKTIIAFGLAMLAALGCGCGGISASKTISPMDFFLPGILRNTPPTPPVPGVTNRAPLLAGSPDAFLLPAYLRGNNAAALDRAKE